MKNEFLIKRDKAIFINYEKVINIHPGSMKERTPTNMKNGLKAHSVRLKEINIKVKMRNSSSINNEKEIQLVVFERGHRGAFHEKWSKPSQHDNIAQFNKTDSMGVWKTRQDSSMQYFHSLLIDWKYKNKAIINPASVFFVRDNKLCMSRVVGAKQIMLLNNYSRLLNFLYISFLLPLNPSPMTIRNDTNCTGTKSELKYISINYLSLIQMSRERKKYDCDKLMWEFSCIYFTATAINDEKPSLVI